MQKKVFIKTFGCQMNEYDSNRIYDTVKKIGYIRNNDQNDVDCYILNTCHIRDKAKDVINKVVRYHQPQEDVDTIRKMISKYSSSGGDLHHDNCFYVQSTTPRMDKDYNGNPLSLIHI